MEFNELAKNRYSSRSYQARPVEEEKLRKVLEAGRIAPTAANRQPCRFYVLREEKARLAAAEAYQREWLKGAPVIIVICIERAGAWVRAEDKKNHGDIDAAIAVDHMTLQATELGLATCWICNFDVKKCTEALNLPAGTDPVVILPLAYPADQADVNRHETKRKPLDEIVVWK